MSLNPDSKPKKSESTGNNAVNIGNASNPSLEQKPAGANQLLGKEAEKYLREAGNIEDMPDEKDQRDMDDEIHNNKNSGSW